MGLVPDSLLGSRVAKDPRVRASLMGHGFYGGRGRRQGCRTSAGGSNVKLTWSLLLYTGVGGLRRVQEDA